MISFRPLALLAVAASLGVPSALFAQAPAPVVMQAFDAQLPYRPSPVRIGAGEHLIYELHLTSFASTPLTIDSLTVSDGSTGDVLLTLAGEALAAALGQVPSGSGDRGPVIAPGVRRIVYLDIVLENGAPPASLSHRIGVRTEKASATIDAGSIAVDDQPLPVLGPPLRGGAWVAVYAPEMERGHRRVIYATAGRATIPGRFAIDWMKADEKGRIDRSDGKTLAESYSHGAKVLAVADAIVAAVRNDFAEPVLRADLPPVTIGDATGNYVALDLGGGRFAFYEHLQPGVRVKVGDWVKRGDVIGRVGLTGQGSAPHLHFHVASSASPLGAEGLPFLLDEYRMIGRYVAIGDLGREPWPAVTAAETHPSLPAANSVVRFPD
ncbi:M23 family metallopeptidase [Sphingopyxis panaciterrae]